MVGINEMDRDMLRFLWSKDPDDLNSEIVHFEVHPSRVRTQTISSYFGFNDSTPFTLTSDWRIQASFHWALEEIPLRRRSCYRQRMRSEGVVAVLEVQINSATGRIQFKKMENEFKDCARGDQWNERPRESNNWTRKHEDHYQRRRIIHKDYERTSNCGQQHLRKHNRLSIGLNLEHCHRPVYVRFGRSLATGKFTSDYEAIVIKDLSKDIWSPRTVEPTYYRVEGLISRPVKEWSLKGMKITHSWASNTQQCLYTKMLFRLHVWQFKISWTSLFQWRFKKGLYGKHYLCLLHLWGWAM